MSAIRHFTDLSGVSAEVLRAMLSDAAQRKARLKAGERSKPLEGKVLAMIFDKPSTRTRVSFDVGMRQLGGETIMLIGAEMQLGRSETIADTAEVRAFVRREFAEHGKLVSSVVPGKGDEPTKFEQYYQFEETVKTIPSHRFLAIRRGEAEGVLRAHVSVDTAKVEQGIQRLAQLADASQEGRVQLDA